MNFNVYVFPNSVTMDDIVNDAIYASGKFDSDHVYYGVECDSDRTAAQWMRDNSEGIAEKLREYENAQDERVQEVTAIWVPDDSSYGTFLHRFKVQMQPTFEQIE